MSKEEQFKIELKNLLEKFKASIGCNIEGDTHCLSYEMYFSFGHLDNWTEYPICRSSEFDSSDIEVK